MATVDAARAVKRQLGLPGMTQVSLLRTTQYQGTTVYHFKIVDKLRLVDEKVKVVETHGPLTHDVTVVV